MKKHRIVLLIPFLFLVGFLHAQEKTVKGTITDQSGQPIIGANVVVQHTNKGAYTDLDGSFDITVNQNEVLVISYIGYLTKEVLVGDQDNIEISLEEDASLLGEVVVVAYTTQKKETMTSSVVKLKEEKLTDVTVPEVATMLQGKVSGVQVLPSTGAPGSAPNILIRGRSSINSTNSPLWVIDGVIVGNSDPKLNPNDVANISVLKDASATALYGNRGANGVIIVTTKRGKIGEPQLKMTLKSGVNKFNPGNFRLMNSRELYDYHVELENNNPWFNEDLLTRDHDWVNAVAQDAKVFDASLALTSAKESHNLFLSTAYYSEEGTVDVNNKLDRYSLRTNLDYNVSDRLTIKPKLNFVIDRRERVNGSESGVLYEAYTNMPWDNPFAEDGSVVNATLSEGDEWLGRDKRNFFYDRQWNYSDSRSFDFFTSLDFEYKLLPGLSFISTNNFRRGNFESLSYTDPRSNSGRTTNGSISDFTFRGFYRFTNQMLRYTNTFNDNHSLKVLLGYEYNDSDTRTISVRSENVLVNGSVQNVGIEPAVADGSASEFAQQSGLLSVEYDFNGLYFAKSSVRVDGASAFARDYRYGRFYSIAAGWNIHKESFFNIEQINAFKLRASHGAVGNQPGGFGFLDLYDVKFQYAGIIAAKPSQLGTENLTWEKAIETNIGVDARLYDKIDFTVDFYNKENSGLLYFRRLSDQTGFSGRFENIGSIVNKGVELALAVDLFSNDDFNFNIGGNISFNKNEVKELADGTDIIGGATIIREGEEFGTYYMRKWLGVNPADGTPVYEIINEDGTSSTTSVYNDATVQIVGTSNPDFTGGFNTHFGYKNFSISSNWSFAYGNELYNSSRNLFDSDGFYLQFNQMKLPTGWTRWQRPGDVTTHPKPRVGGYEGSNQTSTRYLEDGSYLRLNNIRVSYDVPRTVIERIGINAMNIFLSGDNLVTFTKFTGVDPTIGGAGGFVSLGYPVPKRFILGLNVTF